MTDLMCLLVLVGLLIIDIVQGAMITALHIELDFVSRICNTYMVSRSKSLVKTDVKSGKKRVKFEQNEQR